MALIQPYLIGTLDLMLAEHTIRCRVNFHEGDAIHNLSTVQARTKKRFHSEADATGHIPGFGLNSFHTRDEFYQQWKLKQM